MVNNRPPITCSIEGANGVRKYTAGVFIYRLSTVDVFVYSVLKKAESHGGAYRSKFACMY
jgi:hypothetical protein